MPIFLRRLAYFLLPIALLTFPLDYVISHYLQQSKVFASNEYMVWNDIYSRKLDTDIAIYGSSRAFVQFDPAILADSLHGSVYNFGVDGNDFGIQYLRHQLFLKYNKLPKKIVCSLDIYTLEKNKDLYNKDQFLPYLLYNQTIMPNLQQYNGFQKIDYYLPLTRYYGNKYAINCFFRNLFYKDTATAVRIRGYNPRTEDWNDDFDKAQQKIPQYEVKIDAALLHLFRDWIQECAQKKIEIVLVHAPEYIAAKDFITNRAEITDLYNEIAIQYNIKFIDFATNKICYDKQYFYNSQHLNKKGATLFSRELAHLLH